VSTTTVAWRAGTVALTRTWDVGLRLDGCWHIILDLMIPV
jgi:hypothetical protein